MTRRSSPSPIRVGFMFMHDPAGQSRKYLYMKEALARRVGDVVPLYPVHTRWSYVARAMERCGRLAGRRLPVHHLRFVARARGRIATRMIRRADVDLVFAPFCSSVVAYLETDRPIAYLSDATFRLLLDYYPEHSNVPRFVRRAGDELERRTLTRADLVCLPSQWAASSAVKDYGVDPAKVSVIPLGANIERVPDAAFAERDRVGSPCRLLHVSVDWERKGGDVAVETLRALLDRGRDATLTVLGCAVPPHARHPKVESVPFLDKNRPEQMRAFEELFGRSDFFLFPTRADCSPHVICEAAAYGLPTLATDTGGVSGCVEEGESGHLLPIAARGDAYADRVAALIDDPAAYARLARGSRAAFDRRLNWDAWADGVAAAATGLPALAGLRPRSATTPTEAVA